MRDSHEIASKIAELLPQSLREDLESRYPYWAPEACWVRLTEFVNRYVEKNPKDERKVKIYAILCDCSESEMKKRLEVVYNAERREFLVTKLRNVDDIEKIRAAALDYFDDKISETMYAIDSAWGDELEIACRMQKRYKTKRAVVEKATTVAEIVAIIS